MIREWYLPLSLETKRNLKGWEPFSLQLRLFDLKRGSSPLYMCVCVCGCTRVCVYMCTCICLVPILFCKKENNSHVDKDFSFLPSFNSHCVFMTVSQKIKLTQPSCSRCLGNRMHLHSLIFWIKEKIRLGEFVDLIGLVCVLGVQRYKEILN